MIESTAKDAGLILKQCIVHSGVHVYLLDTREEDDSAPTPVDNVYGADAQGNILWRIPTSATKFFYDRIYVQDGELHAHAWVGYDRVLDARTGEIVRQEQVM